MLKIAAVYVYIIISIFLLGAIHHCSSSLFSTVICITPTELNKTVEDQIINNEGYFEYNCSSNFTLDYVLQNYTKYFTSNTKIILLPGTHEVSESFGNVVVSTIHDFALTGTACNSDNVTIPNSCSKIECIENTSLGIAFMNTTNVTVSKIYISNCGSKTEQLHRQFEYLYKFTTCKFHHMILHGINCFTAPYNNAFTDLYSACIQYTLLFSRSSHVKLEQMTFEHSVKTCIIAIGINTFRLYNSLIYVRLLVTALDKQPYIANVTLLQHQNYYFRNLVIMPSHKKVASGKSNSDIKVEFHHIRENVRVDFDNITLKYGNFTLTHKNKYCNEFFQTNIRINNFTLIGSDKSCYALVLDRKYIGQGCLEPGKQSVNFIKLQKSQFIQSSIVIDRECSVYVAGDMGKIFKLEQIIPESHTNYFLSVEQIVMEKVHCSCMSAMSVSCMKVRVESLNVTNSCCSGEALVWFNKASVQITGSNNFLQNKGTCISSTHGTLDISGYNSISGNIAERYSGSIFIIVNSTVNIRKLLVFQNNTGKQCGGIMARENSKLIIMEDTTAQFINNSGFDGGALALYDHSVLIYPKGTIDLFMKTHVEFVDNSALHNGGAIYIADEGYIAISSPRQSIDCALQPTDNFALMSDLFSYVQRIFFGIVTIIDFVNNTAIHSGSTLYGGWLDVCDNKFTTNNDGVVSHYKIKTTAADPNDLSVISSNPSRVCICINSTPECNITDYEIDPLYPGQSFQIEAVAVGQRFGVTPSTVSAAYVNSSIKVDQLQSVQIISKICTNLKYTIKSANRRENLVLTVNTKNIPTLPDHDRFWGETLTQEDLNKLPVTLLFQQLNITIPLLTCPLGYLFDHDLNTCVCNIELQKHSVQCDLVNYTVLKRKNQWINATFEHIGNTVSHGVLVHNHCPLDYCISRDQSLKLESPSDQCNFNRSGILCGKCQGNLSLIFGTNSCKECSSMWALLVIPVFVLLGLALVALIIILNLTVTQGTVNALVFYANIVSANQSTFFPVDTTNTFFRFFIAWLNLDLGIETCFISGLDSYTKIWLQFLFPIYIWLLVILIIMASRYSILAARLSGENAVPALATLFLLSYTKLLRITITAFSSAQLEYPDGYIRRVWLYDGSVDFFEPKHAILFVAALLLLLIISAPYTLVLFTIQWLQRLPYHCLLSWVWKLKPLFDAHTGPYREKHRYWPGLLLLIRAVLFVAFSMNVKNDPAFNLLITLITTTCLFAYLAYLGGVHKATYLDILEYIFLLNLSILSAATFYTRLSDGNQNSVIKTSVSIAFIITLAIVLTHIYQKVNSTTKGEKCFKFISTVTSKSCTPLLSCLSRFGVIKSSNSCTGNRNTSSNTNATQYHTHASIELRESLLVQQD